MAVWEKEFFLGEKFCFFEKRNTMAGEENPQGDMRAQGGG